MSACQEILRLVSFRSLGVLAAGEEEKLEAHLESCEVCAERAPRLEEALAISRPDAVRAPSGVWKRVQASLAEAPAPVAVAMPIAVACTFCKGSVGAKESKVYCARCLAVYHEDCFEEHGRCAVQGCGETKVVRAANLQKVAEPVTSPRRRPPNPVWLGVAVVFAGGIGAAAVGLLHEDAAERPAQKYLVEKPVIVERPVIVEKPVAVEPAAETPAQVPPGAELEKPSDPLVVKPAPVREKPSLPQASSDKSDFAIDGTCPHSELEHYVRFARDVRKVLAEQVLGVTIPLPKETTKIYVFRSYEELVAAMKSDKAAELAGSVLTHHDKKGRKYRLRKFAEGLTSKTLMLAWGTEDTYPVWLAEGLALAVAEGLDLSKYDLETGGQLQLRLSGQLLRVMKLQLQFQKVSLKMLLHASRANMLDDKGLTVSAWSLVWYMHSEKKAALGKLVLDWCKKGKALDFPGDEKAMDELERAWCDWIAAKKCPPVGKLDGSRFVTQDGVSFEVPAGFELTTSEDLIDVLESASFASGPRRLTVTVIAPEDKEAIDILQLIAQLRMGSFKVRGSPEKVELRKGRGTRYAYDATARDGGTANGEALVVPYDGQLLVVMGDPDAVGDVAKTLELSGE
ncbi:MAG TPA: zf-HC2 domain-containing protein [Planctomycetota bacterium]|nr:zf-HC2 domain-containing protein [Planctomycetota bacterium]